MMLCVVVVAVMGVAPLAALAQEDIDAILRKLDEVIGFFPPDISSQEQMDEVVKTYTGVKQRLDDLVKASPNDDGVVLKRATLQNMGHNLDLPGAFDGAQEDFWIILDRNPTHEDAIIGLANMWVNASPNYAPGAEGLFKAAQCLHQNVPLEVAQRGLFFAYHYQGRFDEAYNQARFLVQQWPEVEFYRNLVDMAGAKSSTPPKGAPNEPKPTMVACK
ncbi:MAG: hypothetical protein A2516_04475 [Alphaproteobacteria bacterium RIFOXYD12_FULL_60_8]|nr:MAG: hypothetical protein A2516_04475 [Alphaproteobacteria bacterium RIFOXYD12_FULL_60_8]